MTAHAIRSGLFTLSRARPPAGAWIALAVFFVFALTVPRFATFGNLENLLRVASILCTASCGQAIALILGGIEFSFGSSVAMASVVTVLMLPDYGIVPSFALGAVVVILVGAANGALIGFFELPPFLVTLGALMIVAGITSTLSGGLPIEAHAMDTFYWPGSGQLAGVPVPIAAAGVCIALLYFLLSLTGIGRRWYLVGSNTQAARLAGIRVGLVTFIGYAIAGAFCAVAAVILTSRVGSGQPALAPNLPFQTMAACAIGGIPLAGGQGRASQVVCGVLVLTMLNNAVVLFNFPAAYQQLMTAIVIVGSVAIQRMPGWFFAMFRLERTGTR